MCILYCSLESENSLLLNPLRAVVWVPTLIGCHFLFEDRHSFLYFAIEIFQMPTAIQHRIDFLIFSPHGRQKGEAFPRQISFVRLRCLSAIALSPFTLSIPPSILPNLRQTRPPSMQWGTLAIRRPELSFSECCRSSLPCFTSLYPFLSGEEYGEGPDIRQFNLCAFTLGHSFSSLSYALSMLSYLFFFPLDPPHVPNTL